MKVQSLIGVIGIILTTLLYNGYTLAQFPSINDLDLAVEPLLNEGLHLPTKMAFLSSDDILILEKDEGTVRRILNGVLLQDPLLHIPVLKNGERGMLGIALKTGERKDSVHVFLYYTETTNPLDNSTSVNKLYRYDFINNTFRNPKLLLNISALPGPVHNGGDIKIGPDGNVYIVVGDTNRRTLVQNVNNGPEPVGTGGILRLTEDGKVTNPILGDTFPLNLYYGYGIRNSFGIDFDPLTGKLWDTENGPDYGDEINLVEPGFNSGWIGIQGFWLPVWSKIVGYGAFPGKFTHDPSALALFDNRGKYSEPKLATYNFTIGPTAIKFFDSDKLGTEYHNGLFVADAHKGNIYFFRLNENRTSLSLEGLLDDQVANNYDELEDNVFGKGFGTITDLKVGPDGYLYVLSFAQQNIYRILPKQTIDLLNSTWQAIGSAKLSKTNHVMEINVNTTSSQKEYNRAYVNTSLGNQYRPISLNASYTINTNEDSTIFAFEIRDATSNHILWSKYLANMTGTFVENVPRSAAGKPIQLRIYAITNEPGIHKMAINRLEAKY